jgi:predicted nucleic acid-binding protein
VVVVVDTGPLYAAADHDDKNHRRCLDVLESPHLELLVPALVVAEATYLIGTRLGPRAEAAFLSALRHLEVESPSFEDWSRMADLVLRYESLAIGGTDASLVALAERHLVTTLVTLDRRHFSAIRPRHGRAFRLLPE